MAKCALVLMVAIYTSLSLAQNSLNDPALSDNANAMTWPMLPGENVASLAALFYPKNPALQKRFIDKTLQLSREIHPQLDAQTAANQATLIMIPTLKSLSKSTGRIRPASRLTEQSKAPKAPWSAPLKMSYGLKDAALFVVPEALQAQYQGLLERNESLKLQLDKLNARLAQLQQTLASLTIQAQQLLTNSSSAVTQLSAKPSIDAKSGLMSAQPATPPTPTAVGLLNKPLATPPENSFNLLLLLPLLLLAILLVGLARWYTHQRSKQLYLASVETFDPIALAEPEFSPRRVIDDVDFSLTQSGLTTMSVTDLSNVENLQDKEDGELVLEQAKIYVHIDRVEEAIDLLQAHIQRTPKTALHHWLYLLDIYRDTGQQEGFMQYAEQLHQTFNVMLPLWENKPVAMVVASSIEEFPHIVQVLTALWNDPDKITEVEALLEDLLTDNRDSQRTGFSMEVFQEILLLKDILLARDKLDEAVHQENDLEVLELS